MRPVPSDLPVFSKRHERRPNRGAGAQGAGVHQEGVVSYVTEAPMSVTCTTRSSLTSSGVSLPQNMPLKLQERYAAPLPASLRIREEVEELEVAHVARDLRHVDRSCAADVRRLSERLRDAADGVTARSRHSAFPRPLSAGTAIPGSSARCRGSPRSGRRADVEALPSGRLPASAHRCRSYRPGHPRRRTNRNPRAPSAGTPSEPDTSRFFSME